MLVRPKWFKYEKQQVDISELEGQGPDAKQQPSEPQGEQRPEPVRHAVSRDPPSNPLALAYRCQSRHGGKWLRAYREDVCDRAAEERQ